MTIDDFCKANKACGEGVSWAKRECKTMEEVWQKARQREPMWLVWIATRPGVLSGYDLRKLSDAVEKKMKSPIPFAADCPLEEKVWRMCWQIVKDEVAVVEAPENVGIKAVVWKATWQRIWKGISAYIIKSFNPMFEETPNGN